MRQPQWDKFEAALLIEAYWKIKADRSQRAAIIATLSTFLRQRANFEIDDIYRNVNGINMRLGELDYLFTGGQTGLKNTSDLFREMVELYVKDRTAFEAILSEAKDTTPNPLSIQQTEETTNTQSSEDMIKQQPAEPESEKRSSESISPTLAKVVDTLIKSASEGITKTDLCTQLPNYNTHQINLAIAACHAVLVLKKYYHPDNISDYQEMADILLEVIMQQFSTNGNYTSAQQLYNEARAKLDDFFFYNNAFNSRQEVYDLAVHLFVQEKYKGNSFIFMNNMHIWKEEPDYPKDYHGLLIKYAREHENVFSREEAISYFDRIGSPSSAQTFSNVIFNTGSRSFLQYSENQFILTEALHVNDYFLASVKAQIENLLEGEDYIAIGEIDDYFYTTLPSLPSGVCWSALLLEDLLRVYDIGFAAIEAGDDNDKKTVPAAIVRKNSSFRTFGDIVWNEVSKIYTLPKEFTAQEFREFLLDKGFIHGSEKMYNVHKTVAGDIRFFWTDKNGRVTIN